MSKLNQKEHIYPVYTLLYTLPGIPSLYYGSEWGIEGRKEGSNDDFLRPALSMEDLEKEQDSPVMDWVKKLGEVNKKFSQCLAYGRYRELLLTNRQYAFARFTEEQGLLTAVNNDEQEAELFIPAPFQDKTYVNLETEEEVAVENGRLHITVKAAGSAFLEIR